MRIIATILLVIYSLFVNAQVENGCISIDFESFPNEEPRAGLVLSDQYKDAFGLSFRLEGGGFPVLADVGGLVAEAFGSAWGNDTPAPGVDIGEYFLTDDGQLAGLLSPPIILDFETPIDSFAGCILDMDFDEFFIIQALDEIGNIILEDRIDARPNQVDDGRLTCWGFNLPGCEGSIYSIRYAGFRPEGQGGAFGLGMDFFSFCYSGLQIDTEITAETCTEKGSINIFSTTSEIYEYSLDNVTFSTNGFFDGLDEGNYDIYVRDDDACITTVNVIVALDDNAEEVEVFLEEEICEGQSYMFNGEVYTTSGMYQQVLNSSEACDTIWNLSLTVYDSSTIALSAKICEGETYELNDRTYDLPGEYQQTLSTSEGCDSLIILNLSVNASTQDSLFAQICQGESFNLNGEIFFDSGSYAQLFSNSNGCDSVLTLELEVLQATTGSIVDQICEGEIYQLNGEEYLSSGVYVQNLIGETGCDSILTLELEVLLSSTATLQAEICEGQTYELNGESYLAEGIYNQSLTNGVGCDSILTIELSYQLASSETVRAQICEGEVYELNGENYTTEGSYIQNLNNVEGCDSTLTLILEFLEISSAELFEEICEGETVVINNLMYNTAGSYSQSLTNVQGCDSILNIDISVLPSFESCEEISIFEGDELKVNGEVYTQNGTYEQLLQSSDGCDSLLVIKLEVEPLPLALVHYDMNDCAAGGSSYDEFIPKYTADHSCADISATILSRPSGLHHSCTAGQSGDGMCISSLLSCNYDVDSEHKLVFEVEITPTSNPTILAGLRFYEKAPARYEWNVGTTGLNNYPTLYGIRIYKDEILIYDEEAISTNLEWTLQSFSFRGKDEFEFSEPATLKVEFLPYCAVGIASSVSAWDIDELSLFGYCQADNNRIEGSIFTNKGEAMPKVELKLSSDSELKEIVTDREGKFAFETAWDQSEVMIEAYKNDDPLNGISTIDIVHIQRHILGLNRFENFDSFIAADINRDTRINGMDLIELRKLILGVYDRFPENTSWRFLDSHQNYTGLSTVSDQMIIRNLDDQINLSGIKIGDIDRSNLIAASSSGFDLRTQAVFDLNVNERISQDGQTIYEVYASEDFDLLGFQLAIDMGDRKEFKVLPHKLVLKQEHFNLHKSTLRMSWSHMEGLQLSKGELLFEIVMESSKNVSGLKLDTTFSSEIYASTTAQTFQLSFANESTQSTTHLVKDEIEINIVPNPFRNHTLVSVKSTIDLNTKYELIDSEGRLLETNPLILKPGDNQVFISRSDLPNKGIYFLRVYQKQSLIIKKLIVH